MDLFGLAEQAIGFIYIAFNKTLGQAAYVGQTRGSLSSRFSGHAQSALLRHKDTVIVAREVFADMAGVAENAKGDALAVIEADYMRKAELSKRFELLNTISNPRKATTIAEAKRLYSPRVGKRLFVVKSADESWQRFGTMRRFSARLKQYRSLQESGDWGRLARAWGREAKSGMPTMRTLGNITVVAGVVVAFGVAESRGYSAEETTAYTLGSLVGADDMYDLGEGAAGAVVDIAEGIAKSSALGVIAARTRAAADEKGLGGTRDFNEPGAQALVDSPG